MATNSKKDKVGFLIDDKSTSSGVLFYCTFVQVKQQFVFNILKGEIIPDHSVYDADECADGIFETMHVREGKVFLLDHHLARLSRSFDFFKIDYSLKIIHYTGNLISSYCKDFSGKLRVTFLLNNNQQLHKLILTQAAFPLKKIGFKLLLAKDLIKKDSTSSHLKTTLYLSKKWQPPRNILQAFDDLIYLNEQGRICESSFANIFMFKDGKIITPAVSEGCVEGVCRQFLMENFSVENSRISADDLMHADEIFLSNALRGIIPVHSINDHILPIKLVTDFQKKVENHFPFFPSLHKNI